MNALDLRSRRWHQFSIAAAIAVYHPTMACDELREARCEIHFRDPRPPHEIQFQLESTLVTLFQPSHDGSKLLFQGAVKFTGCPYLFELRFNAALPNSNCYALRISACWDKLPAQNHDYFRRSSESWFQYWTKPFQQAAPPDPEEGSVERYRMLEEQALTAETHLTSVGSVQQAILSEMRKGGHFSTAHKEGGTVIRWRGSQFVSADYGESEETRKFSDDASFLLYLRQFYDWETFEKYLSSQGFRI